ncbi:hypothetical protein [Sphingomonas mesophila]|uniref:hypothetical protein n=1 Tax=Sphingomonas mesophila TaxID=2303576 RepID=UPI000E581697|nr:hypothetical protein [Sphingomonas mesophila]
MTADHATTRPDKTRKLILQTVIGAIAGASATLAALFALDGRIDIDDPSRMLALITGLVLMVIGLFVGFGLAAPKLGSQLLNVEDADELHEQRRPLSLAALILLFAGAGLMALAMAATGDEPGVLSPRSALILVAIAFAGTVIVAVMSRRSNDELMRSLSAQACVLTLYALLIVGTVWATLAHLGFVGWITPLGFLAGLTALQLLAGFVVVGRSGLMTPR